MKHKISPDAQQIHVLARKPNDKKSIILSKKQKKSQTLFEKGSSRPRMVDLNAEKTKTLTGNERLLYSDKL